MKAKKNTHTNGAGVSSSASKGRGSEPDLWEFVPLSGYEVPAQTTGKAADNAWSSFKRIFMPMEEASLSGAGENELPHLPQTRLQQLVPSPDWSSAAAALDGALQEWTAVPEPDRPVQFLIGQPYNGHAEIIRHWAGRHRAELIASPAYEQILAGNLRWFDNWPSSGQLWVLPNLEHCYLRHAHGLKLIRQLLARAESGQLGRGLIGCDSWAWAYLQRIWPVPRPDALTLQAFDGPRLARFLAAMANPPTARRRIRFRNAANGSDILVVPLENDQVRSEFHQLAAHCRGNLGIAVQYWRKRLRAAPAEEKSGKMEKTATEQPGSPDEEWVWVTNMLPEPALPSGEDEDFSQTLHALMLHAGLPASILPQLLPLPPHRCMALLFRLRNAVLAHSCDGRWSVPGLACASVRSLLRSRDYLIDSF
ncbi:MAG TPA: hypothetical protein ENN06_11080 [Desulfobacteraceae bacterium]|nr:hypothetical protein [Desulfobacteraceae bacterium]